MWHFWKDISKHKNWEIIRNDNARYCWPSWFFGISQPHLLASFTGQTICEKQRHALEQASPKRVPSRCFNKPQHSWPCYLPTTRHLASSNAHRFDLVDFFFCDPVYHLKFDLSVRFVFIKSVMFLYASVLCWLRNLCALPQAVDNSLNCNQHFCFQELVISSLS